MKHLSSFDIVKIGFIDRQDLSKGLVSVGKENIRFWWIKGKREDIVLASHSTYLGEHARNNIFSDFVVAQTDDKIFKILVVANTGNLYILDSSTKEMIGNNLLSLSISYICPQSKYQFYFYNMYSLVQILDLIKNLKKILEY